MNEQSLLSARGLKKTYLLGKRTLEVLRGVEGISFVYFDERDVVRHSLVQRIVKAYERYQDLTGTGRQLALRLAEPPVEAATSASEPPSLAEAQGPEIPLN